MIKDLGDGTYYEEEDKGKKRKDDFSHYIDCWCGDHVSSFFMDDFNITKKCGRCV